VAGLGSDGGGRSEFYIVEILPVSGDTAGERAPAELNFQPANYSRVSTGRVRFGAKKW
jgi:hypothetical protein